VVRWVIVRILQVRGAGYPLPLRFRIDGTGFEATDFP
jgi:hypothetical protein